VNSGPQVLLAELVGTALLLMAIVGSGLVVAHDGPLVAQLFPHAVVVGLALAAIITAFGPVSGAHLNPVVTLALVAVGRVPARSAPGYIVAQTAGAILGAVTMNAMAGLPLLGRATTDRLSAGTAASEVVATAALVLIVLLMVRADASVSTIGAAVGAWIAAAIVLLPSASFANPAVTLARTLTDGFTGIAPGSVPGYVLAQALGAVVAVLLLRVLRPSHPSGRDTSGVPGPGRRSISREERP